MDARHLGCRTRVLFLRRYPARQSEISGRGFCMNSLAIEVSPPNENGVRFAVVKIDGRELLDIVRAVEAPLAAAVGEPDLAGKYHYLPSQLVLHPSRHLLGVPSRPLYDYDGRVSVLECDCGCDGCWPL